MKTSNIKIKTFGDRSLKNIDDAINSFIELSNPNIIDIKVTSSALSTANSSSLYFVYVVIYKD